MFEIRYQIWTLLIVSNHRKSVNTKSFQNKNTVCHTDFIVLNLSDDEVLKVFVAAMPIGAGG